MRARRAGCNSRRSRIPPGEDYETFMETFNVMLVEMPGAKGANRHSYPLVPGHHSLFSVTTFMGERFQAGISDGAQARLGMKLNES